MKTVRLKCVVKMQHSDVAGDEQVLTFGNTEQAGDALVRSISCGQTPINHRAGLMTESQFDREWSDRTSRQKLCSFENSGSMGVVGE